jgi:DNA replication protein DnaC
MRNSRLADIDAAVTAWNAVLRHPWIWTDPLQERAARHNAGSVSSMRYQATADLEDLERALELHLGAVAGEPDGPFRPQYLSALGRTLRLRYSVYESPADLEAALRAFAEFLTDQDLATAAPEDLISMATLLRLRFDRDGNTSDIDTAVGLARRASELVDGTSGLASEVFTVLGNALAMRHQRGDDRADLDAAIEAFEHAASMVPYDHPNHSGALQNLGVAYRLRFELTREPEDLDRAIDLRRQSLDKIGPGSPARVGVLHNLSGALEARARLTGDRTEPDEFVTGPFADGMQQAGSDATSMVIAAVGMADQIQRRYERLGSLDELNQAIDVLRRSAGTVQGEARGRPVMAALLRSRYERTGDLGDLIAAADILREAAGKETDDFRRASYRSHLAACLQREVAAREAHGGGGRIRYARFPARKSLEEFDFDHQRSADRKVISHLGTLDFVVGKENVIFLGPPGTGKTHLATGLGIRACQAGHRVAFANASQWVSRLADAHQAGRLQDELIKLGRIPLLMVDEVGYIPFEAEVANLFFQLVSSRYEQASLIVTSNMPFGKAHMFV